MLKLIYKKKSVDFMFMIITTVAVFIVLYLLSFLYNCESLFLSICLVTLVLYLLPANNNYSRLFSILYYFLLCILTKIQLIKFEFLPQANELLKMDDSLLYWILSGHPHSVRLLISYPGYIFSQIFNVNLNIGFTYYCIILLSFLYFLIIDNISKYRNNKRNISFVIKCIITLIPLLILAFIMNGRLIPAFFGFMIVISLFLENENKKIAINPLFISKLFFGFLFTMVSSGTMTVTFVFSIISLYITNSDKVIKKKNIKKIVIGLIILLPVIYKFFTYFLFMLNKNITFYGGGIDGAVNMLNHGAGKIFVSNMFIFSIFVFIGTIFLLSNLGCIYTKVKSNGNKIYLFLAVNIAFYGIFFGISTGLMMIPPCIVLIMIRV